VEPIGPRARQAFRIVAFAFVLALLLVTAWFLTPAGGTFP
jgi:hypothetical protein